MNLHGCINERVEIERPKGISSFKLVIPYSTAAKFVLQLVIPYSTAAKFVLNGGP